MVDQASFVDENPGYATKDTYFKYKPGKLLPTNNPQEKEGFRSPGIRLTTKGKPIPEYRPLRFRGEELQKQSQRSVQRLVSFHTVGNWINTY